MIYCIEHKHRCNSRAQDINSMHRITYHPILKSSDYFDMLNIINEDSSTWLLIYSKSFVSGNFRQQSK